MRQCSAFVKRRNEFDQNDDPARNMCCWGLHVLSIDLEDLRT